MGPRETTAPTRRPKSWCGWRLRSKHTDPGQLTGSEVQLRQPASFKRPLQLRRATVGGRRQGNHIARLQSCHYHVNAQPEQDGRMNRRALALNADERIMPRPLQEVL